MNTLRQFQIVNSFRRWVNRLRIRAAQKDTHRVVDDKADLVWGTVFIVCVVVGLEWVGNLLLK